MEKQQAQVVIIGGGAIGLSVAYHLAHLGIKDILLLERDQLTSGTSWHAAGIVGPLRASMNLTQLARYALELFVDLEVETGQATGYQQTGGVWLAQNAARMIELQRIKAMGERNKLTTQILSAAQIQQRVPILHTDDLAGGLWVDEDGHLVAARQRLRWHDDRCPELGRLRDLVRGRNRWFGTLHFQR